MTQHHRGEGAGAHAEILCAYRGPLGPMTLAALPTASAPAQGALVGCWFDGQAHDRAGLSAHARWLAPGEPPPPVLAEAVAWLDTYLSGADPGPCPPLAPRGSDFQSQVWDLLRRLPRGSTTTYGALARQLTQVRGRLASARAVGAAVGRNPVSLFIPCHRVIGARGSLVGYAGGEELKRWLLAAEGALTAGG